MILLDGRGHDAGHPDAVAAHEHGQRLALLVEHRGLHRLAVQLPELEDMADLDAARNLQAARAGRARVARCDVADVARSRFGQIAAPVHAGEVHVLLVGAADEIRQVRGGMIDVDRARKPIGPIEPGSLAGGFAHPFGARHAQRGRDAGELCALTAFSS